MVHAAQPLHAEPLPAALRIQLQRQLRLELGEQAELVSLRADGQRRLRPSACVPVPCCTCSVSAALQWSHRESFTGQLLVMQLRLLEGAAPHVCGAA